MAKLEAIEVIGSPTMRSIDDKNQYELHTQLNLKGVYIACRVNPETDVSDLLNSQDPPPDGLVIGDKEIGSTLTNVTLDLVASLYKDGDEIKILAVDVQVAGESHYGHKREKRGLGRWLKRAWNWVKKVFNKYEDLIWKLSRVIAGGFRRG